MAEISIIVTAFNVEGYIDQCLQSVAAQTLRDIEVLVVDDGSCDSTPGRIADFCARDPRFTAVLLPVTSPGGVATAANAGLDHATATWVGFVDGDDFVEPRMFERLLEAATACGADLAMCDYQEVVDGTEERRDPSDAHRWAELTERCYLLDVPTRRQFLRFIAVPWRKLYRRDLLEDNEIRFPVTDAFYEDNPFHWFVVLSARAMAVVPEVLCFHRVGRAGQTMATADAQLFQIFRHHDTIHAWLAGRRVLDIYETSLMVWVISQTEWISRRTPPELRRRLFDTLVPIFAAYSRDTLRHALRDGNKGASTRRLCAALARRDYGEFDRALSSRPASTSPVSTGIQHLRRSGLRHTAVLTSRYVRNRLRDSVLVRGRGLSIGGRHSREASTLFGLTVIQRQLRLVDERLDGRLDQLDGRLTRIEEQLAELSPPSAPGSTPQASTNSEGMAR